ncbi:hypothetical protein QUF64_12955 [Anaerolineales bacterium HSG6]|nr:hypothetical protein [Anaerolineales bacterium HSG6]MDM8532610.1 hypothetical protein [Anaerolineales bacterium HSG25]
MKKNWQSTLWHEWRNSHDEQYAQQLYTLIADTPANLISFGMIMVLGAITGAALGLLAGLALGPNAALWQQLMLMGAVIGSIRGGYLGLNLSWRAYLTRLGASLPVGKPDEWLVGGILLSGLGTFVFGPAFWICAVGLFWGMGGMIEWLNSGSKAPTYEYTYRAWFFWWRALPTRTEVQDALRRACIEDTTTAEIWTEPLQRLATNAPPPESVHKIVSKLSHDNWLVRLQARHQLIQLGETAIEPLKRISRDEETPMQPTAQWVLDMIGKG